MKQPFSSLLVATAAFVVFAIAFVTLSDAIYLGKLPDGPLLCKGEAWAIVCACLFSVWVAVVVAWYLQRKSQ